MFEFLGNLDRMNHRSNNKNWIADNRVAIAGGRNIGDEYFAAVGTSISSTSTSAMVGARRAAGLSEDFDPPTGIRRPVWVSGRR
jgi:putative cardiolipin synthase